MDKFLKQAKAVMIGHAVGDALGVPVEFQSREYLKRNPVSEMKGYGTYPVPKGTWSDDTSMSLCALASLVKGHIDYDDIMHNFVKWYYNGDFTATGEMFDIGITCTDAIFNYHSLKKPYTDCGIATKNSNGNGSLMRIHPFALYLYNTDAELTQKLEIIHTASKLTHAHMRSQMACGIYSFVLWELLKNPCKASVSTGLNKARLFYRQYAEVGKYERLFSDILRGGLIENDIKSNGYVVHTLEAAVWCLLTTDTFDKCVLKAVNLGEDTDTTAAVAGGLAGALYGYDAIPEEWRQSLLRADYIEELCQNVWG